MSNRLISFDTETTGLYFEQGDRVVEIGAVEILGRNKTGKEYQTYLNPEGQEMSAKAAEITNINDMQLKDKPLFKDIADICKIIDTVALARKAFPGQKNNLNSLSARLGVSGYDRTYHGALLDAQILADTYLHLTGGQITFDLSASQSNEAKEQVINQSDKIHFTNFKANENDISEHNKFLDVLRKKSNKEINW